MDKDDFMKLIKNKEEVIAMIMKDLDICTKNEKAFSKMIDTMETDNVDMLKMLKGFAKSNRHLNQMNCRLLILALTYTSGGSFSTDVALMLNKLGYGQEALQELFKQKMNGKGK